MPSMTSFRALPDPDLRSVLWPVPDELDPFVVPAATTSVAGARLRSPVVLEVVVERVDVHAWVGGPAFEATVGDGTGSLSLAFPGRRSVTGVDVDRPLVAAGTVAQHAGRLVILNPLVWLR